MSTDRFTKEHSWTGADYVSWILSYFPLEQIHAVDAKTNVHLSAKRNDFLEYMSTRTIVQCNIESDQILIFVQKLTTKPQLYPPTNQPRKQITDLSVSDCFDVMKRGFTDIKTVNLSAGFIESDGCDMFHQ